MRCTTRQAPASIRRPSDFPAPSRARAQFLQLPFIGFAGSCGSQTSYQCLGDSGASRDPSQSYQLFGDVVKIAGNHALKFGADIRLYRLDNITYGNSAGTYTFSTNWTRGPNASSGASNLGQDFAAFLLGVPTAGRSTSTPSARSARITTRCSCRMTGGWRRR
jgi:hypothetical protein